MTFLFCVRAVPVWVLTTYSKINLQVSLTIPPPLRLPFLLYSDCLAGNPLQDPRTSISSTKLYVRDAWNFGSKNSSGTHRTYSTRTYPNMHRRIWNLLVWNWMSWKVMSMNWWNREISKNSLLKSSFFRISVFISFRSMFLDWPVFSCKRKKEHF